MAGLDEILVSNRYQQILPRAGLQALGKVLLVVHRQHEDRWMWCTTSDLSGRMQSRHSRHGDILNYQVNILGAASATASAPLLASAKCHPDWKGCWRHDLQAGRCYEDRSVDQANFRIRRQACGKLRLHCSFYRRASAHGSRSCSGEKWVPAPILGPGKATDTGRAAGHGPF
jgi:hypothetical protein